jgi:hypothetical protein
MTMADIVKTDGSIETYKSQKLVQSLMRSGATEATAERIRATIEATIGESSQSSDIYRRAFSMLRSQGRSTAARYSLRRALFELGPSGHPFEDFVSELFKKDGWVVEPRRILQGKCVPHEVDVYATRNGEYLAAELKYHNDPGYKTDVKVALYVKARFDDIWQCDPSKGEVCPIDHGYLVTNTKFTSQAIEFAECSGITLLGWSYPRQGNLYDRIIASGLYPITVLTTLRKAEKRLLIDKNISTTEQLRSRRELLREMNVPPARVGTIMAEIESLRTGEGVSFETDDRD